MQKGDSRGQACIKFQFGGAGDWSGGKKGGCDDQKCSREHRCSFCDSAGHGAGICDKGRKQ